MVISAIGNNIKNILAEARRVAGLELKNSRETLRSGGEDGLFRIHLTDGTIVEATVAQHTVCAAVVIG